MTILLTADIHLTDNPRDEDRWNLFPWIEKQIEKYDIKQVCILGDLTDRKDRHSAVLVNRLVTVLSSLAHKAHVVILNGNHDCVDFDTPFFGFASKLEGRLTYISKPRELATYTRKPSKHDQHGFDSSIFLPCTKNYEEDWKGIDFNTADGLGGKADRVDYIFTHNTFEGCFTENGTQLNGIPPAIFKGFKGKVWSGDIHVPQKIGTKIEYVGAPYPIRFGDHYRPRLVLLERDGASKDIHFPYRRKELIEISSAQEIEKYEFARSTQVKVRVRLKRSEFADWKNMRAEIVHRVEQRLWELHAIELVPIQQRSAQIDLEEMTTEEPKNVLIDFGKRKKLGKEMIDAGLRFLKGAQ